MDNFASYPLDTVHARVYGTDMQNTTSAPMTDTTGMSEQRIRFEIARLTRLACSYPAQDAYYLWQEIDRLQKLVGR